MIPDFDNWFKSKHGGFSFEAYYHKPDIMLSEAFFALSRETRLYISEMAKILERSK